MARRQSRRPVSRENAKDLEHEDVEGGRELFPREWISGFLVGLQQGNIRTGKDWSSALLEIRFRRRITSCLGLFFEDGPQPGWQMPSAASGAHRHRGNLGCNIGAEAA